MIGRLLIANRGEIAVRIARGARELGIAPLGVYSDADASAMRIGPAPARESYLDAQKIIAAAKSLRADAVHPGYGFLSERASFAQAVVDAGLIFVGPSPAAIAAMGSKIEAKRRVRANGVPVVPGYDGDDQSPERLRAEAERIGTPLLIKASAGGGGRGMRVVDDLATFEEALASAKREALAAFGDDAVLLERYLRAPRHIEFQILADNAGATVYLGERECSIQRRHQKVIEEAPSVALDAALRATMGEAAVAAARSVGYTNAGTAEFMLDADGSFYFLEMNARLQVEHPITELVYGVDLVHEQLRIASGESLRFTQANLVPRGWAIEARLNAEDPARDDLPSTGTVTRFTVPQAPGVRVDTGVRAGSEISVYYDSMIAKLIVWGADRAAAIARMAETLATTRVAGVKTNLPLLRAIVADEAFRRGETTTRFLQERASHLARSLAEVPEDARLVASAAVLAGDRAWRLAGVGVPLNLVIEGVPFHAHAVRGPAGWTLRGDLEVTFATEARGDELTVASDRRTLVADARLEAHGGHISYSGRDHAFTFAPAPDADATHHGTATTGSGSVTAPMPGRIVSVGVKTGDPVSARDVVVVLEAMKMEHRIEAPLAGTALDVRVKPGDLVAAGAALLTIGAPSDDRT
jgi:3-methylcrotonyl-CoA carboxylase alpha subunit